MKRINLIYLLFIVVSTLIMVSCTEEIDLDFKSSKPRLVVDAWLTNEKVDHYVILSKSGDFLSNKQSPPVEGAMVTLSDGDREIEVKELESIPGTYLIPSAFIGEYGKTYTLTISGVDINEDGEPEVYEASNYMAYPIDLHSINLEWSLAQGEKSWHINMDAQENEGTKDFYAFAAYLNDVMVDDQISELEYIEDKYFNGNLVADMWTQSIVEEDSDGEVTDHVLQLDDVVTLEVQSINEDYFDFIVAVDEETGIKIPLFSGPSANVPTNISNNALGFFRVYSIARSSIEVTQEILDQRN